MRQQQLIGLARKNFSALGLRTKIAVLPESKKIALIFERGDFNLSDGELKDILVAGPGRIDLKFNGNLIPKIIQLKNCMGQYFADWERIEAENKARKTNGNLHFSEEYITARNDCNLITDYRFINIIDSLEKEELRPLQEKVKYLIKKKEVFPAELLAKCGYFYNLGEVFLVNTYILALNYAGKYQEALDLLEQLHISLWNIGSFKLAAELSYYLEDYSKALYYSETSLSLKPNDLKNTIYSMRANILRKLKRFREAQIFVESQLDHLKKLPESSRKFSLQADFYNTLGFIYKDSPRPDYISALSNFEEAVKIFRKTKIEIKLRTFNGIVFCFNELSAKNLFAGFCKNHPVLSASLLNFITGTAPLAKEKVRFFLIPSEKKDLENALFIFNKLDL